MHVQAFRHLFEYHFTENRKIWDNYIAHLSDEQFDQPSNYSVGSLRKQIVHLIRVDEAWFDDLAGHKLMGEHELDALDDRPTIRAYWDVLEQKMREFLAGLSEEFVQSKPFPPGQEMNVYAWQALLQVANHGTDHRAQILRQLHDFEIETGPQDYIFFVDSNPVTP